MVGLRRGDGVGLLGVSAQRLQHGALRFLGSEAVAGALQQHS